jgi:hypothetical protein
LADNPANALPLLFAAEDSAYKDLRKAMRAGIEYPRPALASSHDSDRGADQRQDTASPE